MSEREIKSTEDYVEERFNKYKEMLDIPVELEFEYRTMAQLEIQYEQQSILNPDHVKTRAELLKMRNEIKRNLHFQPKTKVMYIDIFRGDGVKPSKIALYVGNEIIGISANYGFDEIAKYIKSIKEEKKVADVYIDSNGFGFGLKQALEDVGVHTNKLKITRI